MLFCYNANNKRGFSESQRWSHANTNYANQMCSVRMDRQYRGKKSFMSCPYSDLRQLSKERVYQYMRDQEPLEFGHSLAADISTFIAARASKSHQSRQ